MAQDPVLAGSFSLIGSIARLACGENRVIHKTSLGVAVKIAKLALAAAALTTTAAVAPGMAVAEKLARSLPAPPFTAMTARKSARSKPWTAKPLSSWSTAWRSRFPLPFGTGENGATLNATKAQIVGMLWLRGEAMAKRDAALVVGAEAVTAKNALGTVLQRSKATMSSSPAAVTKPTRSRCCANISLRPPTAA